MNNICIEYLKPALQLGYAGKYARRAITHLRNGELTEARTQCVTGHFVSGHEGDKSFLPAITLLDKALSHVESAMIFESKYCAYCGQPRGNREHSISGDDCTQYDKEYDR